MKKNLILMTALFAGSMIVNDGFGCIILKSKSTLASPMIQQQNSVQVVESNNNTQRDEEQGVDNQTQLNENKDDVKHKELKEEQTVIQSDSGDLEIPMPFTKSFPHSPITKIEVNDDSENKMDVASAIPPVELVKVLSQDVVTKEEEKKDSVSVESSEDLNGNDSNKIDGTDTISVEPDAVFSQDVTKEEEQKDKMDVAQNGDSANQTSLKGSESEELSSSDKKKLRKSAPRTPRKNKRART